jgi:hypothetical protein
MISGSGSTGFQQRRSTKLLCGFLALLMLGVWGVAGTSPTAGAAETLAAPTSLAPDGITAGPNPTFTWSPVVGATYYKVTYPNSAGTGTSNSTVYAPSFAPTVDLPTGSIDWSVTAYNSTGNSPAALATFTNSNLASMSLNCPASKVTYPSNVPTFSWNAVPGVKTYTLLVSTSSTFVSGSTTTYKTQATSLTLSSGQSNGQTYYAQVSGATSSGISTGPSNSCSYQVVWTNSANPLDTARPVLLSPHDGAHVRDVLLEWKPMGGAARYEVEISPNGDWTNGLLYDVTTDGNTWSPAKTLNNGAYFWRVRGIDNVGNTSLWSDSAGSAWQFTIDPLGVPQRISPMETVVGGVTTYPTVSNNSQFKLSWAPVPGAGAYELQVSDNVGFNGVGTTQTCFTTHTDWSPYVNVTPPPSVAGPGGGNCSLDRLRQVGLTDASTLYWHVRSIDNYTQGEVADPWSTTLFTNQTNHPPTNGAFVSNWSDVGRFYFNVSSPVLQSPSMGSSVSVPTMSWSQVPGTEYYLVSYTTNEWGWDKNTLQCTAPTGGASSHTAKTTGLRYTPDLVSTPRETDHVQCPVNVTWTVLSVDHSQRQSPTPLSHSFKWSGYSAPTSASITPVAPSPADGATITATPSFAWNPVTGADHYEVWWFSNPAGSEYMTLPDYNQGGASPITEAFTPVQPLPVETGAYMVVALNASNVVIASSAKRTVTVAPPASMSPTSFSVNNANGSTSSYVNGATIAATPLISWTQNPDVSYYRVYISQDVGFTNVVRIYDTEETNIRSVESLLDNQAGQSYYVYVQPRLDDWYTGTNSTGTISATGTLFGQYNAIVDPAKVWSFHKQSDAITGLKVVGPASSAPGGSTNACDDGTNQPIFSDMPTFCWNANSATPYNSADVGPMQYHVQVSTTSDFTNIIDQAYVDQASYTPYKASYNNYSPGSTAASVNDLTYPDGPIYWRVQAVDGTNTPLTYSAYGSYTKASEKFNPITVTAPSNGATVSATPSLTWLPKTFAAQYNVQVFKAGDTSFSDANKVFDQKTDLTAITPSANNSLTNGTSLPADTYTWRVRAIDADGNSGAWTYFDYAHNTPYTFTVQPSSATLLAPTNQSIHTTYNGLTFDWTPVTGAVQYRIYISASNPPTSSTRVNLTTVSTAYSLATPLPSGTYYWEVLALDAQGKTLSTSTIWKFTYDNSRPSIGAPAVAPQDGSALVTWEAIPAGAVGPITSFTIVATDKSVSPNTTITRLVLPTNAVEPPGSGGGGGNTVCNTATPQQCAYVFTGLANNHTYSIVITPNDANGPGTTSAAKSVKPGGFAPFTSATNCVKRLWSDLEGVNTPTSGQVSVYVNYINAGHTCADVAGLMWQSGAFLDQFPIARLYQAYFLRIPDYGGLTYWIGLHRTRGYKTSFMSDFFVQSQEFKDTYGSLSNADYVALVYENVLNRDGRTYDPKGYNYWLDKLNKKTINRGQLMLLFSESAEYVKVQMPTMKAELLVLEFLRRTPTQAEVNYYKSQMAPIKDNPATYDAQVQAQIRTIMFTTEYKARAN